MTLFKQAEVEALALSVGFSPADARVAAAIAMVESGTVSAGVPVANSDLIGDEHLVTESWGPSVGLWQVRSKITEYGTGGVRDAKALLNPSHNARSALSIYGTQGWRAWTVYQTGAYKAYLPDLFPPPPYTHIVVAGDTLSALARHYGTTVTVLAQLNKLSSPYPLSIGQHLKLPEPPPPPPYVPPPFPTGLKPDSASPSARPLQRTLKAAGYMPASVPESDNYGPRTQAGVVAFHDDNPQFRSGQGPDPAIGPKGWAHLHRLAYEVTGP